MPDETQTPPDVLVVEAVRDAVTRADETLTMLAAVPIAGTQAAENQMRATRLGVLERLLADVRAAVGLEPPPAAGQQELDVEEPSA